ncbi:MAG TPA: winged helix-turn-helix domain-containing protein [Pirellulaceae bacterium]|nr:winged helix-turn-helix domain-containing protein [Pirellulaceae bacterium]
MERRRLRAAALIAEGLPTSEIARRVGSDPSSVRRWKAALREGGTAALAASPHPGPKPKLNDGQKDELAVIVRKGAVAAGFSNDWWTTRRVAKVVRDRFGVSYHFNHVGKLLKALGFSQQKPRLRASQRDEQAIETWRQRDWPRIKNGLVAAARPSCFSTKRASCCAR